MKNRCFSLWATILVMMHSALFTASTPTPITSSTTITSEGIYTVFAPIASPGITIAASDVVLTLSGYEVTGLIINDTDPLNNIHVSGGTVVGSSDAVRAENASNIYLENITAKDATQVSASNPGAGIHFINVIGGEIKDCFVVDNQVGVKLEDSHKIVIDNVIANCNVRRGFSLISSTTCCVQNCKAVSTGQGNTGNADADGSTDIIGFEAMAGFGNNFDQCIANNTRAENTVDYDSLVAGFALRADTDRIAEQCSAITNCEASNALTRSSGYNVPQGIVLEPYFATLNPGTRSAYYLTIKNDDLNPDPNNAINSVDWRRDQKFIAVSFTNTTTVSVLAFQETANTVNKVSNATPAPLGNVIEAQWSPDGQFVAVITNTPQLLIYQFCDQNLSLAFMTTPAIQPTDLPTSLDWHPNSQYIAVGTDTASISTYKLDAVNQTITQLEQFTTGLTSIGAVLDVQWSPDGNYLGAALTFSVSPPLQLRTYSFINEALTQISAKSVSVGDATALAWSPDQKYLATIGACATCTIYQINDGMIGVERGNQIINNTMTSLDWSADSGYLVVGSQNDGGEEEVQVLRFNRSDPKPGMALFRIAVPNDLPSNDVNSVRWSPDGQFILAGTSDLSKELIVYRALSFPQKNVITDNVVYTNAGNKCSTGVGVTGSSVANLITRNVAYANPYIRNGITPLVSSNYIFVTNVFDSSINQAPSDLQNSSINFDTAIATPEDLYALGSEIKNKLCTILDLLDSSIDNPCSPMPIYASDLPTTISISGVYCLAEDATISPATHAITIGTDDVTIDLNNHTVNITGRNLLLSIGYNNITVQNGSTNISGNAFGLHIENGQNIMLSDINITVDEIGIALFGVSHGVIENCKIAGTGIEDVNSIGIYLQDSHSLEILDTTCIGKQYGFYLIQTSTCCVKDCKAIDSGKDVTQKINTEIFGFVSSNGHSNIFERCIANATQALSTTDSQSIVAGFALRGDEKCTKIIDSEAANSTTSPDGVTVPYGILLEAQLSGLITVTRQEESDVAFQGVSWSPDGKYLAAAHFYAEISIYEFDRIAGTLTQIANILGDASVSIEWSPDGNYLAAAVYGSNLIQVYSFDRLTNTISALPHGSQPGNSPVTVSWSPDGNYLAAGFEFDEVVTVYQFNNVTESLNFITNQPDTIQNPRSVSWSSDGKYLAAALKDDNHVTIYEFNKAAGTLIKIVDTGVIFSPESVAWSPDGKYIVTGLKGINQPSKVFEFNREIGSLTLAGESSITTAGSVGTWSPDGKYIAISFLFIGDSRVQIYKFNRGASPSNSMILVNDLALVSDNGAHFLAWSPDGKYLAVTMEYSLNFTIFDVLDFPSKNVITNNTVYCNSGGNCPSGVGISGSSIQNMIIGNTSYSNPIPQGANHPIVSSNYQFVTNVFNPLFGQAPTDLQNISLDGCAPICMPEDPILLLKQIKYALSCAPIAISASSLPTTIATAGVYCLSEDVSGTIASPAITIAADNVTIDLNDHVIDVSGAVPISSSGFDTITIKNGRIDGSSGLDGMSISSAQNIKVSNVAISNCLVGVNFTNVQDSAIEYCSFTQNTTGLQLTSCGQITVNHCSASRNLNAGYDLIDTGTSCLQDCKAISTGQNNSAILNQTIFGFVSSDGYGNIFERCIANATQALSTTDSQSIVAGFALRGSEGCSKIIECESANATTSSNGVTVPYGILIEGTLDSLLQVTTQSGLTTLSNPISSEWSPDGKYVAVADLGANKIIIYAFNRTAGTLTEVTTQTGPTTLIDPISSQWSPDGTYVAVADDGGAAVIIYAFDRAAGTLIEIATQTGSTTLSNPESSQWSPDGKYVAVADLSANKIIIYAFNSAAETLTEVTTQTGPTILSNPKSSEWSPDGTYVAVVNDGINELIIYEFDSAAGTLTEVITPTGPTTLIDPASSEWSPDGKYVAVADLTVAVVIIYAFDRAAGTLTEVATQTGPTTLSNPRSSEWSPDGTYVAVADFIAAVVIIYDALNFPSKNVIKGNTVYCNSGGSIPSGVGISGSSICNMIIGNTSYSNPIDPFMVPQNYIFVTNVFNQLFGDAPSDLQNISLGGCEPICQPCDLVLIAQQNQSRISEMINKIHILLAP